MPCLQDISYQSQSQSQGQGQGQSQGQSQNSDDLVGTKHLVAEFHSPKVLKIAKGMLQRPGSDNTKVRGERSGVECLGWRFKP